MFMCTFAHTHTAMSNKYHRNEEEKYVNSTQKAKK